MKQTPKTPINTYTQPVFNMVLGGGLLLNNSNSQVFRVFKEIG